MSENRPNRTGVVRAMAGLSTYIGASAYDAAGRLDARTLGTSSLYLDYVYNPWTTQGGRLQQIKAGISGNPTSLQDLRYTYDAVGNVLTIQDYKAGNPQTQTFTYDSLDRLLTAGATGGTGGNGDYATGTYAYGPTGNITSMPGVGGYNYFAAAPGCAAGTRNPKPHAVAAAGSYGFDYDCNGNMTHRIISDTTYLLGYDAENHMTSVTGGSVSASFSYDGDGNRVMGMVGGVTTYYIGAHYEWTGSASTARKYYYAGAQRLATRQGIGALYFLLGDHLGSTSITADGSSGAYVAEVRYMPFGRDRYVNGTTPTTYRYTGQRQESGLGPDAWRAGMCSSRVS